MSRFRPVLALHGGAGTIRRAALTPEREAAYRQGCSPRWTPGGRFLRRAARRSMR